MNLPQLVAITCGIFAVLIGLMVVSVIMMIGRMSDHEHREYRDRKG